MNTAVDDDVVHKKETAQTKQAGSYFTASGGEHINKAHDFSARLFIIFRDESAGSI